MRRSSFVVGSLLAWLASGCSCSDPPSLIDATVPVFDSGVDAAAGDAGDVDAAEVDAGRRDGGGGGCGEEVCGDGLDGDCDALVDEGCGCVPGDTAACFLADPSFRGVGQCVDGRMVCTGDFEFGRWGPCEGAVGPSEEQCDAAGLDEDCDGAPNDGCGCSDGDPDLPCGTDVGACVAGVQRCVDGRRTACEGAIGPVGESCNGMDDDCDGAVDEALTRSCGVGVGVCRTGTEVCADGAWGVCTGAVAPADELCDLLDNDCDGMVDEAVSRTCGSDVGACVAGTETCAGGTFGACVGRTEPVAETCNGMDDDCDGSMDEGLVRGCGTDVGRCVAGTETCVGGVFGACMGATDPIAEACDGVLDEDCDGAVDNGCDCVTGAMRACGTDVGRCMAGSQTCDAMGMWGACMGATDPRTETCDGTDDDCDGTTDEGCDCITGTMRACGSSVGECRPGAETCDGMGRWGPCLGARGPVSEVCNMRDDDCDTRVDEGDVCPRFPPTAMCPAMQSVVVGTAAALSGSGSDPDGGSVSYRWTVVTAPVGSTAAPMPVTAASTSFTPDVAGTYTLQLCVTDDEMARTCCTVDVTGTPSCVAPSPPTGVITCPNSWDRRPIVEFDPVPAGIQYELSIDGTPYGTTSVTGQNYFRPPSPLGAGVGPTGPSSTIVVRACRQSEPMCCSTGVSVTTRLVQECTTPVAPMPTNIVISEYVIDGDGACPGASCEAGEAIEITNLSHCPVALREHHLGYCTADPTMCSADIARWRNFGDGDVIPARGVYVAIRNPGASMCAYPFLTGGGGSGLFGRVVNPLDLSGMSITSGWFRNTPPQTRRIRVATGSWTNITGGTTVANVDLRPAAPECSSTGFSAVDQCGNIAGGSAPSATLTPNQLGRLWHPCDAVAAPNPPMCN